MLENIQILRHSGAEDSGAGREEGRPPAVPPACSGVGGILRAESLKPGDAEDLRKLLIHPAGFPFMAAKVLGINLNKDGFRGLSESMESHDLS